MIIKSLTIGNYKNLAETRLDFNKIVSLVSTNNYGKSNLLEAISFAIDFIFASSQQRMSMMSWPGGIPLAPSLAQNEFIFMIEFDTLTKDDYRFVRYGYKFKWIDDNSQGEITDEILETRPNESVRYTSYLKRKEGTYKAEKSKANFRKINLSNNVLAIDIIPSIDNVEIATVVDNIKELKYELCQSLELDYAFQPHPVEIELDNDKMRSLDEDIPKALYILSKENPNLYDLFKEIVLDLFPEIENVELKVLQVKDSAVPKIKAVSIITNEDGDDVSKETPVPYHINEEVYRLFIKSRYLNQPVTIHMMSTGTKRIFWLIANAVLSKHLCTNLICVDEIETSIHPKMIKSILEALTETLDNVPLIITSHSPYLVQYLKPESLYVGVPNDEGVAVFRRIKSTKENAIKRVSRDLGLSIGEYIFELLSGDKDSYNTLLTYLEEI